MKKFVLFELPRNLFKKICQQTLQDSKFAKRVACSLVVAPFLLFVSEPISCFVFSTRNPITGAAIEAGVWSSIQIGMLRGYLAFLYVSPALHASIIGLITQIAVTLFGRGSWWYFILITIVLEVVWSRLLEAI